jgi:hypothetical protein
VAADPSLLIVAAHPRLPNRVDEARVAIMWHTDHIMTVTVIIIGWRVGNA